MATLTDAITAGQQTIDVTDGGSPRRLAYYRIDSEVVQFIGFYRQSQREDFDESRWNVVRGLEGTASAAHDAGAALTATSLADAGGAITVTDGETTVEGVTTLGVVGPLVSQVIAGEASIASYDMDVDQDVEIDRRDGEGVLQTRYRQTEQAVILRTQPFEASRGGTILVSRDSTSLEHFDTNEATLALLNLDDGGVLLQVASVFLVVSDAGVRIVGLPSTDPEVAGALFTSGAPGPADPKALMVSGG